MERPKERERQRLYMVYMPVCVQVSCVCVQV